MRAMPSVYMHRDSRSIADLNMLDDGRVLISRINVPVRSRGRGLASKMLKEILRDADAMGITLILEPVPSGGLDYEQLVAWYQRHGFMWVDICDGKQMHRIMERLSVGLIRYLPSDPDINIERVGFANHIRGLSAFGPERTDKDRDV